MSQDRDTLFRGVISIVDQIHQVFVVGKFVFEAVELLQPTVGVVRLVLHVQPVHITNGQYRRETGW